MGAKGTNAHDTTGISTRLPDAMEPLRMRLRPANPSLRYHRAKLTFRLPIPPRPSIQPPPSRQVRIAPHRVASIEQEPPEEPPEEDATEDGGGEVVCPCRVGPCGRGITTGLGSVFAAARARAYNSSWASSIAA